MACGFVFMRVVAGSTEESEYVDVGIAALCEVIEVVDVAAVGGFVASFNGAAAAVADHDGESLEWARDSSVSAELEVAPVGVVDHGVELCLWREIECVGEWDWSVSDDFCFECCCVDRDHEIYA